MSLQCPNCHQTLNENNLICPNNHQFRYKDDVLVLLNDTFAKELAEANQILQRFRADEDKRLLEPAIYPQLPYYFAKTNFEWRIRAYDVANILTLLDKRPSQKILDIGAWNGWLTHQLVQQGHEVTAIDYFIDEYDGLGAKKFYHATWQAIQLDLTDLSILDKTYDLVIINHGLQFFPDPLAHLQAALKKVAKGGFLISLGLQIFNNPTKRIQKVADLRQSYRERYGREIFLKPTKAYLDTKDKVKLEGEGLVLNPYQQLWWPNLIATFIKTKPQHFYGIYTK